MAPLIIPHSDGAGDIDTVGPGVADRSATVVVYGMSSAEATLPALWMMQNSIALRLFLVYEMAAADRASVIGEISDLLERGRLVHTVARRLPVSAIADAHDLVERGEVMGNVVLDVD
jgi:NADPH2:quinone reductase